MTAHLDIPQPATPTSVAPQPIRGRHRRLLPAVAAAAALATVGVVTAGDDGPSRERARTTPELIRTDATAVVSRPSPESAIVRAERAWAGDEFELAPVDRATTPAESSIIRAERAWGGDEFDRTSTDLCPMRAPC